MFPRVLVSSFLAISFLGGSLAAGPVGDLGPEKLRKELAKDIIPLKVSNFRSEEVLRLDLSKKVAYGEVLLLENPPWSPRITFASRSGSDRRRGALPVLLSILVPGAGELYMGYYGRAAGLIALEVAAWTGYAYYRDQGLDTRAEYESFADAHWHMDDFLLKHPSGPYATLSDLEAAGESGDWKNFLRGNVSEKFFYMPFISKAEDKQHYYENIGKYNWFISGWDDWDDTLDSNNNFREYTDNREIYRSLRVESNDQLERADRFIYLSIAARAFSLVETILLTRGEAGGEDDYSLRVDVEPRGWETTRISLECRFK